MSRVSDNGLPGKVNIYRGELANTFESIVVDRNEKEKREKDTRETVRDKRYFSFGDGHVEPIAVDRNRPIKGIVGAVLKQT